MKRLRFILICIIAWLFFFYNIERLSEPINIASFVYVYTAAIAIIMLVVPPLYNVSLIWPYLISLVPFFAIKYYLGYQIGGAHLPFTITEMCAIGITMLLVGVLLRELKDLRDAVDNLTISQLDKGTYPFETGQGAIYREIRRARAAERQAALVAISITDESLQGSINRFIEEAQRDIIQKYISARVAHLLIGELRDYDVITKRDNHFVALLPELDREKANEVVTKLEAAAKEKLGIYLKFGVSTFPDEAVTFEMLLENAEARMNDLTLVTGLELKSAETQTASTIETVNIS